MARILFLLSGVLLATGASAGTIYKCRNAEGVMLYQEKPCEKEVQAIASWVSTSMPAVETGADTPVPGGQALVLGQGQGGHYFVDGSVNDSFLNFVIDTGATFVTLPYSTATSAGVRCEGKAQMQTGNGVTHGCTATIQKLKFGQFTLRHVNALLLPNLSQPLLGMNVLKQFRVEQDNGQMRLSRKY